jgi:hypothetical protein
MIAILVLLSAFAIAAILGVYSAMRPYAVIEFQRRAGLPTRLFGYEVIVTRIGGALLFGWSVFLSVLLFSE